MSQYHCPYCREGLEYQGDLSDARGKPLQDRIYVYLCHGQRKDTPHSPVMLIMEVLSVYEDRTTKAQSLRDVNVYIYQVKPRYDFQTELRAYRRERNKNLISVLAHQVRQEGPEAEKQRQQKKKWNDPNKAAFKCLVCQRKTGPPNYKLSKIHGKYGTERTLAYECKQEIEHKYPITFHVKRMVIDSQFRQYDVPAGFNVNLMISVLFDSYQNWERFMSNREYDPRVVIVKEE